MKLSSLYRTLSLLQGYLLRPHRPRADVTESQRFRDGCPFPTIEYSPNKPPRKSVILVHGVTARATFDSSLVHLARSLASLGYRCVTPPISALAQFRHDVQDADDLASAIAETAELDHRPVGVISFSYGASVALCAAARPCAQSSCSSVLGFGAYYELSHALEHQRKLLIAHPDPSFDTADIAFLRYTLLACHRNELDLSEEAWQEIDANLQRFTTRTPIEQKRAPLLKYARHIDFVELMQRYQSRKLPESLSPRLHLPEIRCPVGLLHDPHDRFVPSTEAQLIRECLDRRTGVAKTLLLETPMMSHVQIDPRKNFRDLPRLTELLDLVLD